jgi:hypothetical protein
VKLVRSLLGKQRAGAVAFRSRQEAAPRGARRDRRHRTARHRSHPEPELPIAAQAPSLAILDTVPALSPTAPNAAAGHKPVRPLAPAAGRSEKSLSSDSKRRFKAKQRMKP